MKPVVSILLAVTLSACASTSYVAKVNDEKITGSMMSADFKRSHFSLDNLALNDAEITKFLEKAIDRRLMLQEAIRTGIPELPPVVEEVDQYEATQTVAYLVAREVDDKSKATPEEMTAVYLKAGELVELSQIVVPTEAEAREIRARLVAGGDFATEAREHSIGRTTKYGGKLAPVGWGLKDEERERQAFALTTDGQLSPVFHSDEGWEILRLEARQTVKPPSFKMLEAKIRGTIESRKKARRDAEFQGEMWKKYGASTGGCDLSRPSIEKAAKDGSTVVCASWSGGSITLGDFASRLDPDKTGAIAAADFEAAMKQSLEDLLREQFLRAEGKARGYDHVPKVADAVAKYREDLYVDVLYGRYVLKGVAVSDAEVQAAFDKDPMKYGRPERRLLSQIVVSDEAAAQDVVRRFGAGEPFADVARAVSIDKRAATGGVVGWTTAADQPPYFAPVFALAKGAVSAPIKGTVNYHVVRVDDILPGQSVPFDKVKDRVRKDALTAKQRDALERWRVELLAAADVEINQAGIHAFAKQLEGEAEANRAAAAKAKQEAAERADAIGQAAEAAAAKAAAAAKSPDTQPAPATEPAKP